MKAWLQFFRIVNLPTVPGDLLVGAAAVLVCAKDAALAPLSLLGASLAACALYLFGLADNDILGAATDGAERPIPAGALSLRAARLARGLCLFAALVFGAAFVLPPAWWVAALFLLLAIVLYNRTKWSLGMGLCRGFNVLCGAACAGGGASFAGWLSKSGGLGVFQNPMKDLSVVAALLFTAYITAVTRYSSGEDADPAKRRTVGLLIGALVYLQLGALLAAYWFAPTLATRNLLLVGAALLILLRAMKRTLPGVSAS